MIDPLQYVRPCILALAPYSTARDEFKGGDISVWLDANESPYPHSTTHAHGEIDINRYPDPHQRKLKAAISRLKGMSEDTIFIGGAGSDEAIDLLYRIFCEPGRDNVVAMDPSYGVYGVAAEINNIEYRAVPLGQDFSLDVNAMLCAADANTKIMWICSPNNPTGNAFDVKTILGLCRSFDGIVAVDEAYIDFSGKGSLLPWVGKERNLVVLQTFSKAWGMASLRLGMAFADPAVARLMAMVKYPYNVNGPTQIEVIRQISRDIRPQIEEICQQRQWLAERLAGIETVKRVYHSDANFLLVKVDDANAVYDYLVDHGILVRNRSRLTGCSGCLRITVGTPDENMRIVKALSDYPHPSPDYIRPTKNHRESGRRAHVERSTSETSITVDIDLDGEMPSNIDTGLKFFDHMLDQIPHHSGISLSIKCQGDLEVDEHHTMEDVAIALGHAIAKALADKRGIDRYGFVLPMDESRAMFLIDFGGRDYLEWDVTFTREYVGDTPTEMYKHFFKSLASAMHANIHVAARGDNNHHLIESVFKAFARSLRMAVRRDPFSYDLPSSKGLL